jgi:hypothetical protein
MLLQFVAEDRQYELFYLLKLLLNYPDHIHSCKRIIMIIINITQIESREMTK